MAWGVVIAEGTRLFGRHGNAGVVMRLSPGAVRCPPHGQVLVCLIPWTGRQRTVALGVEGANLSGKPMTLFAILLAGNLTIAGAFSLVAVVMD